MLGYIRTREGSPVSRRINVQSPYKPPKKAAKPQAAAKNPRTAGKMPAVILRAVPIDPRPLGSVPVPINPEMVDHLIERIATGQSVKNFCEETGIAQTTIYSWMVRDAAVHARYVRARNAQMDVYAERLTDMAEAATPEDHAVVRLRIETQKWLMSKLANNRYGDKTVTELTGAHGGPIQIAQQVLDVTSLSEDAREALRDGLRIALASKQK